MLLFFYGSHPQISLLELKSIGNSFHVINSFLGAQVDIDSIQGKEVFNRLGGFPRVASILTQYAFPIKKEKILADIQKYVHDNDVKKYIVSHFGGTERVVSTVDIMRALKEAGIKSKYSGKINERYASPTSVFYLLRRNGTEFCLVKNGGVLSVCATLAVQDPNYWSLIDFDRPRRDQHIGMLPSKLARIMINMTGVQKNQTIFDPFVGQGTIIMQSALLGMFSIGSDKNPTAVQYSKENIDWLLQKGLVPQVKSELFVADIQNSAEYDSVHADGIATETFLGAMRSRPFANRDEANRAYEKEVLPLLQALLGIAEKVLVKGKRLVFVTPIYKFLDKKVVRWYNPEIQFNRDIWKRIQVSQKIEDNIWIQKDSTIGREIVVLEKGQ